MTAQALKRCKRDQTTLVYLICNERNTPLPHYGCPECGAVYCLREGELDICNSPELHISNEELHWRRSKS